jgi:hypothetical protein
MMPTTAEESQQQQQQPEWEVAASPYWAVLPTALLKNPRRRQAAAAAAAGRSSKDTDSDDSTEEGFSPWVAFCFTINYILGTGFLTIPWAFVQSGLVLSVVVLLMSAVISDMAKDYLLESMARAEAMLDYDMPMHWRRNPPTSTTTEGTLVFTTYIPPGIEESELENEVEEGKKQHKRQTSLPEMETEAKDAFASLQHNRNEQEKLFDHNNSSTQKKKNHTGGTTKLINYGSMTTKGRDLVALTLYKKAAKKLPTTISTTSNSPYMVENRKFEVNTLCRVFIGKRGVAMFILFISFYLVGLLWAYTSVFASAMAKALPLSTLLFRSPENTENDILSNEYDGFNYTVYAILFGAMVIPLSCLEMTEQVTIQVFMTACRFAMLFLMIHTVAMEDNEWFPSGNQHDDQDLDGTEFQDAEDDDIAAPMIRWQGLYKTLPILVVANMYHHSIPGLSHPVADKTQLTTIFRFTTLFTSLAYSMIGVCLGAAFGFSHIQQSVNLNWNSYPGHPMVKYYILLFPALDVISAFPLNAITLGNNMFGAYYGAKCHDMEQNNRPAKVAFRLLASVPPVIGGMFIRELGVITDYTGTTGFVIGFSIPALLFLTSKAVAQRKQYSTRTLYTTYASRDHLARAVFWFGIIMVVLVLVSLILFV